MDIFLARLQELFSVERIARSVAEKTPEVILAIVVFGFYYIIYRIVNSMILRMSKRVGMDRNASGFLLIVVKYTILVFGAVSAFQQVGINVTNIIAGLGLAGLSLGFAARDTLGNIIAGIFLFWDKPFVIGDLIEAGGEYGEVREITLRTTRIVTVDHKMVSIPNSVLINNTIKSYTMEPNLRLDVEVTIGVNEEIGRAREVLLDLVKGDERFMDTPGPSVVVSKLGDYFVALQLRVWLNDERQHIAIRLELREKIKEALDRAGVVMPYETLEVIRHQPKTG